MKTCPDCGRELESDVSVCPLCGAQVPKEAAAEGETPQEAPAVAEGAVDGVDAPLAEEGKPKGKAAVFVPIAIACAVVLGLAIWLASGLLGRPDRAFLTGHGRLLETMAKHELAPLSRSLDVLADFNADMTLTVQMDDSLGVPAKVLNDAALRMRANSGRDGGIMDAAFDLGDDTILEATVTGNKDGILGFYIPQLSETFYTMDYWQFVENNSDGQITITDRPEVAPAELEKSLKAYGDILTNTVNRNNVTQSKGRFHLYYIPSAEFSGTAYMFKPTAKDLETLFTQLADALAEDKTLRAQFDASFNYVYGLDNDPLNELVDTLRTNGAEMAREIADSGFTWTLREGKGTYQVELAWDGGENAIRFERTPDSLCFSVTENGEMTMDLSGSYHQNENGTWHGKFSAAEGGEVEWENVDPETVSSIGLCRGRYAALTAEGEEVAVLDVTGASNGGTDHTLTVGTAEEEIVTLNLHTTDQPVTLTFPDAPVEDITGYTNEDFEALGEKWSQNISSITMRILMYAYQYQ